MPLNKFHVTGKIIILENNSAKIPCKILLVEDEPISIKVISLIFNELNCELTPATCGNEALELFNKNTYDIILMDIGLPDLDGLEVTKRIRLTNQAIPIIVLSAHSSQFYKQQALLAGSNDFMVKPVSKEDCKLLINKYFMAN